MSVTCPCGTVFEAKHPRARYCSDRCRKRPQRGAKPAAAASFVAAPRRIGAVEAATAAELEAVGRLNSSLGAQCLTLARRLDMPGMDTGSAMASVSRELRATLAEAKRGAGAATSPQQLRDELAERRVRHGA
jgi:hypothetical protein